MDPPPPPAYQTDTPPNETALAPTSSVQINSFPNLSGIRDQILGTANSSQISPNSTTALTIHRQHYNPLHPRAWREGEEEYAI
jgi:hypothetical protein